MRTRSLQTRLAVRLGLLFLVGTGLAAGVLVYETYRNVGSIGEQNLLERARTLARFVETGPRGEPLLDLPSELAAEYESPVRFAAYAIRDVAGHTIASSDSDFRSIVEARRPPGDEPRFFRLNSFTFSGRDYYGIDVMLDSAAGPILVAVAEAGDLDDLFHAMLEEFFVDIAWIIPIFVGATLLVGVLALRSGLRPIRRVSAEAARIGPGNVSSRLSRSGLPSEVEPLVAAVNEALDRLEEGFAVQRRFTANAAHELRTPLTIISGALETFEGNGDVGKLKLDVARMNRLVEQLLRVARLDSLDLDVSADVDLDDVAAEVVEYLAPLAIGQDRAVALVHSEVPVIVRGNRQAIADALRNLVENAIHHTAWGTEVVVAVGEDGSLSVSDHGSGVAAEDRERVFDRFWRGKRRQGEGAGLGLAIVAETMKAHGGVAEVGENPGAGARVTLRFSRRTSRSAE